jgi:hypothetical protein
MTVSRYFLDGFGSDEALEELKSLPVFPLVRELNFKYGLKVLGRTKHNLGDSPRPVQLCHANGMNVGMAWTTVSEVNGEQRLDYRYRSPFVTKSRGEYEADRQTVSSIKVSTIMAALTRMDAVPTLERITQAYLRDLPSSTRILQRAQGNSAKNHDFDQDEIHAILALALGENPNSFGLPLDLNKCKITLDRFKEAGKIYDMKHKETQRFYTNPFYMIGVDDYGHTLVGKVKMTIQPLNSLEQDKYEVVEQFKRYKNYESCPDIVPIVTMTKLSYENKDPRKHGWMPLTDSYDPALDAVFYYNGHPTEYTPAWMLTPC